jgi:hypothetical protein
MRHARRNGVLDFGSATSMIFRARRFARLFPLRAAFVLMRRSFGRFANASPNKWIHADV